MIWEASAVAEAAVSEGITEISKDEFDVEEYRRTLEGRLGLTRSLMRGVMNQAKSDVKKIVFTEGDHPTVIKAAAE